MGETQWRKKNTSTRCAECPVSNMQKMVLIRIRRRRKKKNGIYSADVMGRGGRAICKATIVYCWSWKALGKIHPFFLRYRCHSNELNNWYCITIATWSGDNKRTKWWKKIGITFCTVVKNLFRIEQKKICEIRFERCERDILKFQLCLSIYI